MKDQQYTPAGFLSTNSLNIRSGKSIADLTSKLLSELQDEYSGKIKNIDSPVSINFGIKGINSDVDIVTESEQAKRVGFSGLQCTNCGSWKTMGSSKCGQCTECGHTYGACG